MNASPDPLDELTRLTSRFLDGDLRDEEIKCLAALVKSTPGGPEHFILLGELHSMLESEPSIRRGLEAEAVPENVVALPGSRLHSAFHPFSVSSGEFVRKDSVNTGGTGGKPLRSLTVVLAT